MAIHGSNDAAGINWDESAESEDIFRIMMQIDKKFGSELDPDNLELTDDEKRALIFIADNFPKKLVVEG